MAVETETVSDCTSIVISDFPAWRNHYLLGKEAGVRKFVEDQDYTFTKIFDLEEQISEEKTNGDESGVLKYQLELSRLMKKISELDVLIMLSNLEIGVLNTVSSYDVYSEALEVIGRIKNAEFDIIYSADFFRAGHTA